MIIILDNYLSEQDFELCYMDTDSFYLVMSGDSLDEIVRPEMKQACEADKTNWLATDIFSERTPGLLKAEFVGTRGVWLTVNIALKVLQRSIMICIFSAIKRSWMFS